MVHRGMKPENYRNVLANMEFQKGKDTKMDTKETTGCCSQVTQPPKSTLSPRDIELVALGASLASNCVPCIEYHMKEARKVKLTDEEIAAAIELADKVRRVPAGKVLDVASRLLAEVAAEPSAGSGCKTGISGTSCC
jgi:AhpD family alkylhydroperoxidase